ncbi:hypothetical protein LPJ64_001115 [Coemansia asiatica]|uniref:SURF6-domain-containing protein n=1 Tax=Coemansia asiatica TaxID=1052880 RepID=A0A9W7XR91_9FUNG|nr:hypothetical protein LPJ64_001115 [Coemansia asiatica]KAJ2888184.1 hypothetical protein FB639_000815 [Coemansia asiatica]
MGSDIDNIKKSLQKHAEVFDDLLRLIPPKFYLPEVQKQNMNTKYMKNTKNETETAKRDAQRKARANAKAARLDPDNHMTIPEIQAQKLEKQVAEKLKIADSPKKRRLSKSEGATSTSAAAAAAANDVKVNGVSDEPSDDTVMAGGTFDLEEASSSGQKTEKPAEIKPMPANGSIGELRQRLKQRIEDLRQKRKAPEDDVSREALLQKRISRRKNSEEAKAKAKKTGNNMAKEQVLGSKTPVLINGANGTGNGSAADGIKDSIYFGKLTTGASKKKNVHVRQQLTKMENKEKELGELRKTDAAEAERIEQKDKWNKALDQAKGQKVKDDVKLLRKAVKRMDQKKAKSSREWTDRKKQVQTGIKEREEKRNANLKARSDAKKMKKSGKSKKSIERVLKGAKSGGITKANGKGPKKGAAGGSKARPGFEGKKAGKK